MGPPLGARSAARFVFYEMFCESMLKPPAAILESLGAVLGAVLGLLGGALGRLGASRGHLGGIVEELEGARRGARPVFYK